MTEDYLRRTLPQNFPVIYQKVKNDSKLDISENCNNICITDYSSTELSRLEEGCLRKCFKKSIELDAYLMHEYNRMFIKEVKDFSRNTGV